MIHIKPKVERGWVEWKAGLVVLHTRCSVITGRLLRSASLPACEAGGFFCEHNSLASFIKRSFIKAKPTASLDLRASAVKSQESRNPAPSLPQALCSTGRFPACLLRILKYSSKKTYEKDLLSFFFSVCRGALQSPLCTFAILYRHCY